MVRHLFLNHSAKFGIILHFCKGKTLKRRVENPKSSEGFPTERVVNRLTSHRGKTGN